MADEQVLQMVARLKDDASEVLKRLRDNMQNTAKGGGELRARFGELTEKTKGFVSEIQGGLNPSLVAFASRAGVAGAAAAAAGAAVYTMTRAMNSAAEAAVKMQLISDQSGIAARDLEKAASAAEILGVSTDQMNQSMIQFGQTMQSMTTGPGGTMAEKAIALQQALIQHGPAGRQLFTTLREFMQQNPGQHFEAMKLAVQEIAKLERRYQPEAMATLGLPAGMRPEDYLKFLERQGTRVQINTELMQRWREETQRWGDSTDDMMRNIANVVGPLMVEALKKINDKFEELGHTALKVITEITKAAKDAEKEGFWNWLLYGKGGQYPLIPGLMSPRPSEGAAPGAGPVVPPMPGGAPIPYIPGGGGVPPAGGGGAPIQPGAPQSTPPAPSGLPSFNERFGTFESVPGGSRPVIPPGTQGALGSDELPSNATPARFATVRYNNPGGMYPGAAANMFGTTGTGIIGGGHKIANFPTPVHGAAANMENLRRSYVGMTIGAALQKWSGGGRGAPPGYDPRQIITPEMARDPNFMIPFMKSIAGGEAPGNYPMSERQWNQAFQWYQAGSAGQDPQTGVQAGATGGSSISDMASNIRAGSNVNIARMNPELVARLDAAFKDAPAEAKLRMISGYRSPELQAQLYQRYLSGRGGLAAPPGRSRHQFGEAADIQDPIGWLHQNAGKYGLHFPLGARDYPHIQMDPSYKGAPFRRLDESLGATTGAQKVEGSASITVDVNAPKGTRVGIDSDGMFKETTVNRSTQMDHATTSAEQPATFSERFVGDREQ